MNLESDRLSCRVRAKETFLGIKNQSVNHQMEYLGYTNSNEAISEIERTVARFHNVETQFIKWDLILSSTNTVIGSCGFHNWYKIHKRAEIGYMLHSSYRGCGYMSECLEVLLPYAFDTMGLYRVEAFISPDNYPSRSLVERFGFEQEGVLRSHFYSNDKINDSVVYGLLNKGPF